MPARRSILMTLLASATALVVFTGVALPAVAQLCMLSETYSEVQTAPCHGDDQQVPVNSMEECCHLSSEAFFDEAVVVNSDARLALQPSDRDALSSEVPGQGNVSEYVVPVERSGGIQFAGALHLLYGVMLN